jgi:FkbM family methyltransferase
MDFDGDLRFRLDRSSYMGSAIYWQGYWSRSELCLLDRILHPSMVFVDVGANQGEFSVYVAKRVPYGRVLAFEPKESSYRLLAENIRLNRFSNVSTYNFGLHQQSGMFAMYEPDEKELERQTHIPGLSNEGVATIYKSQDRSLLSGTMRVEAFDEVFAETGLDRLDIIKIDAEGAELPVLRGAYKSLKQYRPAILLEFNKETFDAAGYTSTDIVDFLADLNYEFYTVDNYRIWDAWRFGLIGRYGKTTFFERDSVQSLPHLCNVLCRCYKT